jgi:hypothetical protein
MLKPSINKKHNRSNRWNNSYKINNNNKIGANLYQILTITPILLSKTLIILICGKKVH